MNAEPALHHLEPAVRRLNKLAPLTGEEIAALQAGTGLAHRVSAHREVMADGEPVTGPSLVLKGWACRVRIFRDGRRQILGFLLPGDLIGLCDQPEPLASTMVTAITEVTLCPAPHPVEKGSRLATAYALSRALDENYLLRHIGRLGRLSAYERLIDWVAEIHERLALAGLATPASFPMPLTQEILADTLGLTSVHVNRTLQMVRRQGLMDVRNGRVTLTDPANLRRLVESRPTRVSASLSTQDLAVSAA